MEPNRREFIKQCAFQKFCNTVLHNEACDAHKELHRHKAREITFKVRSTVALAEIFLTGFLPFSDMLCIDKFCFV